MEGAPEPVDNAACGLAKRVMDEVWAASPFECFGFNNSFHLRKGFSDQTSFSEALSYQLNEPVSANDCLGDAMVSLVCGVCTSKERGFHRLS